MPMLKICTPPPDMYSMNACMGRDFAGATARSHARFSLSFSYGADALLDDLLGADDFTCGVRSGHDRLGS